MNSSGTMGDWIETSKSSGTTKVSYDHGRSLEQSYEGLVDRRSQIADAYLSSTYRQSTQVDGTDPKSTRLEGLGAAERSVPDSAIARVAVSQRLPIRDGMRNVRITERWAGRVLEVEDGVFSAELRPLGKSSPVIVGDLQVDRVDEADRDLVDVDAPFYLIVGNIPITATSQLGVQHVRFSRVGKWRSLELDELKEQGLAMFRSIEVDHPE
jgi:hypothetical protein